MIHGGPGATGCSYPDTMKVVAASRLVVTYAQLGLQELHLVGHSWGAAIALEYLLTGDRKGVRSVTFVGPLLSTPRWIEDANSLVAMLPKDARDAITAATMTGRFDSPEFQAANEVFESQFGLRTPRSQRRLPSCRGRSSGSFRMRLMGWTSTSRRPSMRRSMSFLQPSRRGKSRRPMTLGLAVAMSWAQRLKRVFGIDIEACARCGGKVLGERAAPGARRDARHPQTRRQAAVSRTRARAIECAGLVIEQLDHQYLQRTPRLAGFIAWGAGRKEGA